jgi:hypothetical protein
LVFIDTSHSGNIRFNSVVAYTAARFDQVSREDDTLGHGLFTYAIIEGLDGKAANDKREITTRGLADYVKRRVKAMQAALADDPTPRVTAARLTEINPTDGK